MSEQPLTVKELGPAIGRSASYVYKMRRAGFKMPMGRSTVAEALSWIEQNGFSVYYGEPKMRAVLKSANPAR